MSLLKANDPQRTFRKKKI
jgi:hypothetical protein